jgi:chromosome segregation ATPase
MVVKTTYRRMNMKVEQVATWVGLVATISGAAIGYGTLTEKVATLENSTNATQLESRLTKLETRIEDNDVGRIGTEIQQLRGENEKLSERFSRIHIPSTEQIKSDIRILQREVDQIQERLKSLDQELEKVGKNPLG